MRKTILILLILFGINNIYAQTPDSVKLVSFSYSVIKNKYYLGDIYTFKPRIISQTYSDVIYKIEIDARGNSAGSSSPEIKLFNDTLNLFFDSGILGDKIYLDTIILKNGDILIDTSWQYFLAKCDNYYRFQYSIKGLTNNNYKIKLNEEQIIYYPVCKESFEIYKGDTINYTDIHGLKQALWINRETKPESFQYFHENTILFTGENYYSIIGKIKKKHIYDSDTPNSFRIQKYYLNGQKKVQTAYVNNIKQPFKVVWKWNRKGEKKKKVYKNIPIHKYELK